MKINLVWTGPHTYKNVLTMNGDRDYGIYQIYGAHPAYGSEALLYIGRARDITFCERFRSYDRTFLADEDGWEDNGAKYRIHTGRIHVQRGRNRPTDKVWENWIDLTEHLLIYAHSPAWNSQNVSRKIPDAKKFRAIHVLNWGQYCKLLPEVSGARFTDFVFNNLRDRPLRFRG